MPKEIPWKNESADSANIPTFSFVVNTEGFLTVVRNDNVKTKAGNPNLPIGVLRITNGEFAFPGLSPCSQRRCKYLS